MAVQYADVSVGDELPTVEIPITAALIVSGALASRDFTPVHHDTAAAKATGAQDIFMNILTTNGLVGRFVTDWAGPDATVKQVGIKLGAPNHPGDTMKLVGSVQAKDDASHEIRVQLVGKNGWGNHVEGTVTLTLP
jgi:acyl dehydratase